MSPRNSLVAAAVVAAATAAAAAPGGASAAAQTRNCASVNATVAHGQHGTAHGIRATGVGCAKARTVVRACLRDTLHGWRVSRAPSPDDANPKGLVGLDRGGAHVSFQIKGHGGCG